MNNLVTHDLDNQKINFFDGIALKSGTDLNDCMQIGIWYSQNYIISQSLVHTPITETGFVMIVYPTSDNRVQIVYGSDVIFLRKSIIHDQEAPHWPQDEN